MNDLNDKDLVQKASSEVSDELLLIQKMRQDADAVDGSLDTKLRQKLFTKLSEIETSGETNNAEDNVVAFPFKKILFPTAVAASFLAVLILTNLGVDEQDVTPSSIAKVENQKAEPIETGKTSSQIGSKHLETEMVAIRADLDKLKERIASL